MISEWRTPTQLISHEEKRTFYLLPLTSFFILPFFAIILQERMISPLHSVSVELLPEVLFLNRITSICQPCIVLFLLLSTSWLQQETPGFPKYSSSITKYFFLSSIFDHFPFVVGKGSLKVISETRRNIPKSCSKKPHTSLDLKHY